MAEAKQSREDRFWVATDHRRMMSGAASISSARAAGSTSWMIREAKVGSISGRLARMYPSRVEARRHLDEGFARTLLAGTSPVIASRIGAS
jgi:hypothetical protein